ncbi:MAG TPA: CoA transferase, partial [Acidimicrobiaceae bacterium]|nr:CoA transferase [Acidimicrobiaceae bacterium]
AAAAGPAATPAAAALPLAGVNILDFMWVMAGPSATRVLADWGATVVRVESSHRVETARTIQPFLNDEGGADNTGLYQNMNAGKLGITIDLENPAARDLVEDLVRWADVVAEAFSPKAMRTWGYAYEDLCRIKPDIVMASTCLFGQTGRLSPLAGFGTMGAAMSGFYEMTGWPDRHPAGVFGAYTDYVSPKFLSSAILAALEHRDRTGEGQYIDVSQAEASMAFLAPAVLDYTVNGRLPPKVGNAHPTMSPHGTFATAGDDRWIAVACANDEQWRALCALVRLDDDLAALDVAGRRERAEEIAAAVEEWTSGHDGLDAQQQLQDAGVAAHVVADSRTLAEDPQMVHRRHFREVAHAVHDTMWVEGTRFSMSRSTDRITSAGPTYGEHTIQVLEQILGYDTDRITALAVAGVLE